MASLSGTTVLFVIGGGGGGEGCFNAIPYRSWCNEIAEYDSTKQLLPSGCYPHDYAKAKDQKRAFRRNVSNYKLERDVLYHSIVVGRNLSLCQIETGEWL